CTPRARRGTGKLSLRVRGHARFARDELCGSECGRDPVQRLFRVALLECGAPVQAGGTEEAAPGRCGLVARSRFPARCFYCAAPEPHEALQHRGGCPLSSFPPSSRKARGTTSGVRGV